MSPTNYVTKIKNKINYVIHTKLHTKNKHPIGPNNVYRIEL